MSLRLSIGREEQHTVDGDVCTRRFIYSKQAQAAGKCSEAVR